MKYAIIDGTTVNNTGTIQELFPNTSFPKAGPDETFLTENNVVEVVETLSYTTPTERMFSVDPYVHEGKVYIVRVEPTSEEEQEILKTNKWDYVRSERDSKLKNTDWRATTDRTLSDAWRDYRQALRQIPQTQTDPYNITWPTEPS